jgi:hypothetical protein
MSEKEGNVGGNEVHPCLQRDFAGVSVVSATL